MTGNEYYGRTNSTLWTWDNGTSTGVPSAYTSYRSDGSLELQFENQRLKSDLTKVRRLLKVCTNEYDEYRGRAIARSLALMDEIEELHAELEALRIALTNALK